MELVLAARRVLVGNSSLLSLLGSDSLFDSYIFRWRLLAKLEGTGAAALVLSRDGQWAPANRFNTMEFPRLQVTIYVDTSRTKGELPSKESDAETRVQNIWNLVRSELHVAKGYAGMWGQTLTEDGVRVLSSYSIQEPQQPLDVPGSDSLVMTRCAFGVTLG